MFRLLSSKGIKISLGEESRWFPFEINLNTKQNPEYVSFQQELEVRNVAYTILNMTIQQGIFKQAVDMTEGEYEFTYLDGVWSINDTPTSLSRYGIECILVDGALVAEFKIVYTDRSNLCLEFYIFEINDVKNNWLVKKVFSNSGDVTSRTRLGKESHYIYDDIIDEKGNIKIKIDPEDTEWLVPGEYRYLVKSTFYDPVTRKIRSAVVSNLLPFYIINDDVDRSLY